MTHNYISLTIEDAASSIHKKIYLSYSGNEFISIAYSDNEDAFAEIEVPRDILKKFMEMIE